MNAKRILKEYISSRIHSHIGGKLEGELPINNELNRRQALLKNRQAKIVKSHAICQINTINVRENDFHVLYTAQFNDVVKQRDQFFIEEFEEQREAFISNGKIVQDFLLSQVHEDSEHIDEKELSHSDESSRAPFIYDRRAAVRYAEKWWDSYNPAFEKFDVDCTNFISQCLHAGGAPMSGYSNRNKGWWMRNNSWSYSWSVAHALRWYLPNSKSGLRAVEKKNANELMLGDVICYDFQGDGRFDHNTIVVAKDANKMPLVNAHTTNSRMRYWSYEDSTAYTSNIKYKFFHIIDDQS
jgi:hypothetical protein